MTALEPIGSITSQTASLTVVVFDASSAADWVPTKAAATKAQFTGHPAEVMRGLAKGEEAAAIDVGASAGFAFELEGTSGKLDAYRAAAGGARLRRAAARVVARAPPGRCGDDRRADRAGDRRVMTTGASWARSS